MVSVHFDISVYNLQYMVVEYGSVTHLGQSEFLIMPRNFCEIKGLCLKKI